MAATATLLASAALVASAPERPAIATTSAAPSTSDADRAQLLDGVSVVQSSPGSIPGPIVPFGDAFPVVLGAEGAQRMAVVSAARWGGGRVVAFGHGAFFDLGTLESSATQSGRFMTNALRWAAGDMGDLDGATIVLADHAGLRPWLEARGATVVTPGGDVAGALAGADVLVWGAWRQGAAERAAIATWVQGGGGLVASSLGWGWMQLNPALDLRAHAGNALLAPAGLAWSDGYLDRTSGDPAGFAAAAGDLELTQGTAALDALRERREALTRPQVAQAVHVLTRLIRTLPRDEASLLPALRAMTAGLGPIVPTVADPVSLYDDPLERLGLTLQIEDLRFAAPEAMPAHPAGEDFPGSVSPEAPRSALDVVVDLGRPRWHATGLYAPPGAAITASLSAGDVGRGLALRIGAFTDETWHLENWTRAPSIWSRHPLGATAVIASNAFGGPVYVEVPQGAEPVRAVVRIAGAVEAPRFVLGETTLDAWRTRVRGLGAPYAELESATIALTVPSAAIRSLDDPEALLRFWDAVQDANADLAARPRARLYPERMVADRQIGYGYMHAGYPIMTHDDVQDLVVDEPQLRRDGSWGHFHELGHNHQSGDWTFEGTGEVTVNLFTMHAYDRVLGLRSVDGGAGNRARLTPERIRSTWEAYDAAGRRFADWKADPFLALSMYIQLEQAFGWQAYTRAFAAYRSLADDERPRTDDDKRDRWLIEMSRATGRNLCPFFALWAIPVRQAACDAVAELPPWEPWDERLATATPTPFDRPTPSATAIAATSTATASAVASATPTSEATPVLGSRAWLPVAWQP